MANLQRLWSLLFVIVVIIIVNAEPVRTDGHHEKGAKQRETSEASASHRRPSSHPDESQHIHHRQSESPSHHRRRDTRRGRRSSQAHHKKTSPRRSRHSYGTPLMDSVLRHALHQSSKGPRLFFDHYRSPVFNSFHKYYRDQVNRMEKLRSQLVNRAGQLSGRLNNHQYGYRHSPQKYSNGHVHSSRQTHSNGYRTPSYQSHPGGKRQYKIIRNNLVPVKDIPEDVEVIGRPTVVETHGRPHRPSYTPNVWITSGGPAIDPHNCTKKNREPFHHTEIKSTSVSHNNFSPVHSVISSHSVFSGGKYHGNEEKGPHRFGDALGVSFPGYSNVFSRPVTRIHDSALPSGGVIPSIKSHQGTVRISFGSRGRPQKPSVEEHLNKHSSAKNDQREEIPCIKCPPDTRVEAPRGSDCVIAYPPSPLSCTPRYIPELRTVVTEGPAPGSLLPEGRYKMIITVWTSDSSRSTPVTTCNVNYDVEVRKCPALPEVGGAEVTCTAGRAWGSKCSWVCRGGRVLKGSSITTCTGHSRPHWTHPAPRCDDPLPEKPEFPSSPSPPLRPARPPPSPRGNCPQPPDVPGGRLICELPSVEIIPRRDFIPKDEPAPSITAGDSSSGGGVIRSRSVSTALALHPVGTSCKVECDPGLVLRQSEMDRAFLTCSPGLIWNRSPPTCYAREPPMPRDNDCEDVTLTSDQIRSAPLPVFFNVNGERSEVTCDIHEMKRGQHFVRKCKAVDLDLQTSATCQYVITVEPSVEFPSLVPDVSFTGGSAKNPKNTEYETVADVFRSKGKKHKMHTGSKNKPDKISIVTKDQTEDFSGEELSYFDTFGDRNYRTGHESRGEPRVRSVQHQTERAPRDMSESETQIYADGGVTTTTSPVDSQTSAPTEVDSKRSSRAHDTHVPLNKQGKNQSEVTRGEAIEETETAIMAATMELKILVDDCRNSNHVKKALYELLLKLESCKKLNCHTPKTKCRHRPGREESVVKVSWTVGGPFEPLDDYYYDDVQVPVVETDIDSFMTTAERLIASERTTRAMEAFGAAVDLTSFSLNRLDLVCEDRTYRFDPQTNRCIKRKQQERRAVDDEHHSEYRNVTSGFPQGSVLVTSRFILYNHDLWMDCVKDDLRSKGLTGDESVVVRDLQQQVRIKKNITEAGTNLIKFYRPIAQSHQQIIRKCQSPRKLIMEKRLCFWLKVRRESAKMRETYLGALFLALLTTSSMGADHDVMQVQSPYVVKHPLGPSMEVHRRKPDASLSFRESRNANYPVYGRECFSCATGTLGTSDWSSGSSSHSSGGALVPGPIVRYPSYGVPQSTSSRQEFRSEQKYVNGQPVYELHHERKFQDGQLVHEERKEKDEDDFGVVRTPAMLPGGHAPGFPSVVAIQPGVARRTEEVRHENRTYGSQGYGSGFASGSHGSEGFSSSFDAEVARLREDLHRQVGPYRSQPILPTRGGIHRTEFHTQTRYVNGKPVYVKKEERKYADGRLVHNSTEEKDADDLGTSDLQHQYESSDVLSGGPPGGYYERRHEYQETSNPWYPASSPYYGSGQRPGWDSSDQYGSYSPSSSASSFSSGESVHSSYRPSYESSSRATQEGHATDTHYSRESGALSPQRPGTPDSREHSSGYPSYRPYPSTSTYSREESQTHEGTGSSTSYQPSHESSVHYRQESDDFSSSYPASGSTSSSSHRVQDSADRTSTYYSQQPSPHAPGHRVSYGTYSGETPESASPYYPSRRPVSGSSTRTSEESYQTSSVSQGYRPSPGGSVAHTSDESYRSPSYKPSSGRHPSLYPSYTSYGDRSSGSRIYSDDRYSSSSRTSGGSSTDDQRESFSSDDLEERHLLQSAVDSSLDGDDSYAAHVSTNTISPESSRDDDLPRRQGVSDSSFSQTRSHSVSSERRYGSRVDGTSDLSSSIPRTGGGARTVAVDLSSSSHSGASSASHTGYREGSDLETTSTRPRGEGRAFTINLSSSSQSGAPSDGHTGYSQSSRVGSAEREYSSVYGRGEYSSEHEDRVSAHSGGEHSSRRTSSSTEHRQVGIPGVISGPYTSHEEGDYYDKERYDISPLDDESPQLPPVENEIDSSAYPAPPPVDDRTGDIGESLERDHDESDESRFPYGSGDSAERTLDAAPDYSHSSYLYNRTHTIYGTLVAQPSPAIDHTRRDYSRTSTVDESQRVYPATTGSRHYRYNETRRHSTIVGGQEPAVVSGSPLTSDCTEISGCAAGHSQVSSRRSEIRTSKRYINGQLVGITHYERIYENGKLVHENVTEQGVDDLTPAELQKYGISQLNLLQGSYEPESYSQRHEVRQEKKYVNGQQTYDLHHERRFEDGQLVHENRTEKDEDDLGLPADDRTHLGVGYAGGYSDTTDRHEVRQSQHMQQHVTSESRPGSVGRTSETRHVADTSRILTKPVYTTHRQETRQQQEYINGQPVYDLHHERRYQDGSLVYENRTELDEKESRGSTGYQDALHSMMSGDSLRTASESSYGRPSGGSASRSYDSSYGGSYGGSSSSSLSSSSSHADESYEGSSTSVAQESSRTHESSGSSLGSTLLTGGSSLGHSGGATTTFFGTSSHGGSGSSLGSILTGGSSSGGSSSGHSGGATTVYGTSSRESSGSSLGSSLLTGGSTSGHSGRAATTVIGTSSHDRSGSSLGSSLLTGGSASGHSSRATTTIVGSSHETSGSPVGSSFHGGSSSSGFDGFTSVDTSSGDSSSRQYGATYGASQRSSPTDISGCLSCVLVGGGSGYSGHGSSSSHSASHGYSSGHSSSYGGDGASDGYSQRKEQEREEYYEDGQLVRGREEDRSFRDGQLIQENRRVYSGAPGQIAGAEALQSARTSYVRSASASSSSSSSSSHGGSEGYGARVTVQGDSTGVCDPNPCMNGSTCIAGLRGPLCVCPFGFKGTKCEEAYCPRRFCRYGGKCSVVGGAHTCACKSGYSGERCLTRMDSQA
ncbi:filaggrin-like [Palaemon carinicauda]|uniref:filaggrin-like n=1 Tax=Palaemon carinicauda TaxID=392227 RepID=UPI0035B59C7E